MENYNEELDEYDSIANIEKKLKRLEQLRQEQQQELRQELQPKQSEQEQEQLEQQQEQPKQLDKSEQIKNRGTGAGGSNTNKNGLSFQEITKLPSSHKEKIGQFTYIKFQNVDKLFIQAFNKDLIKYMNMNGQVNLNITFASGCKSQDEVYINEHDKIIYIIEKKFQQGSGSVDEKIQTGIFKKIHYTRLFQNYKIYYIYCLSDWYKKKEYVSTLDLLKEFDIKIFWGNDLDYKNKMIHFICQSENI